MSPKKDNLSKRNKAIKEAYIKLRDVTEFGKRKHTHGWICEKVGDQFFLEAGTVERIVSKTTL